MFSETLHADTALHKTGHRSRDGLHGHASIPKLAMPM